jgi:DNA-binding NarL/FixJ family response regulator
MSYFRGNLAYQRARLYASVGTVQRALDVLSLGPVDDCSKAGRGEFLGLQSLLTAIHGEAGRATRLAEEALKSSRNLGARALALTSNAISAKRAGQVDAAESSLDAAIATGAWDPIVIAVRADSDFAKELAKSEKRSLWLKKVLTASADTSLAASLGLKIPRAAKPKQALSPREAEVHELLVQGLTNEEIAKLLYISVSTTKVHVKHIFEKLGVHSRLEAARVLGDD